MNINPKELHIGSIVRSKKFNQTVTLELADFAEADKHADHSNSLEWFERLEGEPLTEEWLKKFGFEHIKNNLEDFWAIGYDEGVCDFGVLYEDDGEWDIAGIGIINYQAIKYVHQLQNIYSAMIGKDLIAHTLPDHPLSSD